jgi:hypothetical protein
MEKGHYGHYSGNARHSKHATNSWEEEDVKRGKKQMAEGNTGHAEALFDDAHGSYNYGAAHRKSRVHNHMDGPNNVGVITETQPFIDKNRKAANLPPTGHSERILGMRNAEAPFVPPLREIPAFNVEKKSIGSHILGGIKSVGKFLMGSSPTRHLGNSVLNSVSKNN